MHLVERACYLADLVGVGIVRLSDELRVESEVVEVRPSKSRPEQGMIKVRTTTLNQKGEPVQIFVGNLVVPFSIDPVWKKQLLNGWDDIALTEQRVDLEGVAPRRAGRE